VAKFKELKTLEGEVDKGFKATRKHIRDKNLPAENPCASRAAGGRVRAAQAEFMVRYSGGDGSGCSTGSPPTGELRGALARLGEFMRKYPEH